LSIAQITGVTLSFVRHWLYSYLVVLGLVCTSILPNRNIQMVSEDVAILKDHF
jgi:hypothetical protein